MSRRPPALVLTGPGSWELAGTGFTAQYTAAQIPEPGQEQHHVAQYAMRALAEHATAARMEWRSLAAKLRPAGTQAYQQRACFAVANVPAQ